MTSSPAFSVASPYQSPSAHSPSFSSACCFCFFFFRPHFPSSTSILVTKMLDGSSPRSCRSEGGIRRADLDSAIFGRVGSWTVFKDGAIPLEDPENTIFEGRGPVKFLKPFFLFLLRSDTIMTSPGVILTVCCPAGDGAPSTSIRVPGCSVPVSALEANTLFRAEATLPAGPSCACG